MKTVVITGSTRGLGLEMAKCFRASGWNVVINGVNPERLEKALKTLRKISGEGSVEGFRASVASKAEIQALASFARETFGNIDIWINNAGVNQPIMISGLSMYGTSKHAVTYFTQALAKELKERKSKVKAGRLSPGVMITDFTVKALGGKQDIDLSEKTKKFYNTVGDYPDVVAAYLVKEMLSNTKNNAHIEWLTGAKVAWRFI